MEPISELQCVTCLMGSHSVTCHPTRDKSDRPVLNLPTPEVCHGKAELTLVVGYIPRWFTRLQTVTHQCSNHLIAARPGVKPTTSRS